MNDTDWARFGRMFMVRKFVASPNTLSQKGRRKRAKWVNKR